MNVFAGSKGEAGNDPCCLHAPVQFDKNSSREATRRCTNERFFGRIIGWQNNQEAKQCMIPLTSSQLFGFPSRASWACPWLLGYPAILSSARMQCARYGRRIYTKDLLTKGEQRRGQYGLAPAVPVYS